MPLSRFMIMLSMIFLSIFFSVVVTDIIIYLATIMGIPFTFAELLRFHAMGILVGFLMSVGFFYMIWGAKALMRNKSPFSSDY